MKEFAHFHCHHCLPLGQIGQTAKWLQVMCPTEKKKWFRKMRLMMMIIMMTIIMVMTKSAMAKYNGNNDS